MNKLYRQDAANRNSLSIKICGLTSMQDVEAVCTAEADLAGFVFAPSRRRVSINLASSLIQELPSSIKPVGVFVDAEPSVILETFEKTGIEIIQLHGSETPMYIQKLRTLLPKGIDIWKSYSFDVIKESSQSFHQGVSGFLSDRSINRQSNSDIPYYTPNQSVSDLTGLPDAWLLDSKLDNQIGGTGKPFNWLDAGKRLPPGKLILAGGINKDNVSEAVRLINPDGVDCSSGVEINGAKDKQLIMDFCNTVRAFIGGSKEG